MVTGTTGQIAKCGEQALAGRNNTHIRHYATAITCKSTSICGNIFVLHKPWTTFATRRF